MDAFSNPHGRSWTSAGDQMPGSELRKRLLCLGPMLRAQHSAEVKCSHSGVCNCAVMISPKEIKNRVLVREVARYRRQLEGVFQLVAVWDVHPQHPDARVMTTAGSAS